MSKIDIIEVLGNKISKEQHPKLYKLGNENPGRLLVVLKVFHDFRRNGDGSFDIKNLEESEPLEIIGQLVDPFDFPAIYCWYKLNPESFTNFFSESVEKLWAGDREVAMKKLEEYFERAFN